MDSLLDLYHDAIIEGLTNAAGKMADLLRQEAPDNYKNSITVGTVKDEGSNLSIEILIDAPLTASSVDAKPGELAGFDPNEMIHIEPIRAKVLAFLWPSAPANVQATQPHFPLVFFKHVDVRARAPQQATGNTFVSLALSDMSPLVEEEIAKVLASL